MKYFLIQNLSNQKLIDSIFHNVLLAEEVVKFLIAMDEGVESTQVEPSNSMYK